MKNLKNTINEKLLRLYAARAAKSEEGQGLVEYGLILSLISIVAIIALTAVGTDVDAVLDSVAAALVP